MVATQGVDLDPSVSIEAEQRSLDEKLAAFKWLITYATPQVDNPTIAGSEQPALVQPDMPKLKQLLFMSILAKNNFLEYSDGTGNRMAAKYFDARNPVEAYLQLRNLRKGDCTWVEYQQHFNFLSLAAQASSPQDDDYLLACFIKGLSYDVKYHAIISDIENGPKMGLITAIDIIGGAIHSDRHATYRIVLPSRKRS